MSIKHLRNEAGGNPARGPHPDQVNQPAATGNDFPDHATETVDERPQDKPDLDAFAARMGTDSLSDSAATASSTPDDEDARSSAWRASAATVLGGMATGAKSMASGFGSLASRVTQASEGEIDLAALRKRVDGIRTVMVTTGDEAGALSSRPLTVQRVSGDGDVLFIVDGDADWVSPGLGAVNVAFVDDGSTWVSVSGHADVRDDATLLDELWNPLLDSFFPNGRDAAAILEVSAERWEYWTAPNKLTQLVEIVKSRVGDNEPDLGDAGTVET